MLSPGSVEHGDGWRVRNTCRWTVGHQNGERTAEMETERGFDIVTVYPQTLRWLPPYDHEIPNAAEREVVTAGARCIEDVLRSTRSRDGAGSSLVAPIPRRLEGT